MANRFFQNTGVNLNLLAELSLLEEENKKAQQGGIMRLAQAGLETVGGVIKGKREYEKWKKEQADKKAEERAKLNQPIVREMIQKGYTFAPPTPEYEKPEEGVSRAGPYFAPTFEGEITGGVHPELWKEPEKTPKPTNWRKENAFIQVEAPDKFGAYVTYINPQDPSQQQTFRRRDATKDEFNKYKRDPESWRLLQMEAEGTEQPYAVAVETRTGRMRTQPLPVGLQRPTGEMDDEYLRTQAKQTIRDAYYSTVTGWDENRLPGNKNMTLDERIEMANDTVYERLRKKMKPQIGEAKKVVR